MKDCQIDSRAVPPCAVLVCRCVVWQSVYMAVRRSRVAENLRRCYYKSWRSRPYETLANGTRPPQGQTTHRLHENRGPFGCTSDPTIGRRYYSEDFSWFSTTVRRGSGRWIIFEKLVLVGCRQSLGMLWDDACGVLSIFPLPHGYRYLSAMSRCLNCCCRCWLMVSIGSLVGTCPLTRREAIPTLPSVITWLFNSGSRRWRGDAIEFNARDTKKTVQSWHY